MGLYIIILKYLLSKVVVRKGKLEKYVFNKWY